MGTYHFTTAKAFAFGRNWARYLRSLNQQGIQEAEDSLRAIMPVDEWKGRRFLDAGSGSGLFSLAAKRLGAAVCSFDIDPESVACTEELRNRYFADDADWRVHSGSILDSEFVASLGQFDVVYSWGVLHHTGEMWAALEQLVPCVSEDGLLCIAIYNDQGHVSRRWRQVKRLYATLPSPLRPVLVAAVGSFFGLSRLFGMFASFVLRLATLRNPLVPITIWVQDQWKRRARGMNAWSDLVDWVGGWPFEVATPEAVFRFMRDRGFHLTDLVTCGGGHGCNEFVFRRKFTGPSPAGIRTSTAQIPILPPVRVNERAS